MVSSKFSDRCLDVKSQEVVVMDGESGDGRKLVEAGVWSVPVVLVGPGGQRGRPVFGVLEGGGVGPFIEHGLDEALGFAVGAWRVGPGAAICEGELVACTGEGAAFVAGAVVGEHAPDADAELAEPGNRFGPKVGGAALGLVRIHGREGEAGVGVDGA